MPRPHKTIPEPIAPPAPKVWAGRIGTATDPALVRLDASFPADLRLAMADVAVNRAWAAELVRIGILSPPQEDAIGEELDRIAREAERGELAPEPGDEDIHTLIERRLTARAREAGERIHTGRSRNDQVATDLRLWIKESLGAVDRAAAGLQTALLEKARQTQTVPFAAWTHLQAAQVTTFGHYLLSFLFALDRDRDRLAHAAGHADRCPLGSGAVAGSAFPIDRRRLATALGFAGPTENSIDAVGDRDFLQEAGCALAILLGHLSRLATDLVLLSTGAIGAVTLSDAFTTGSSMMPQKKNPDGCELVRAKAARATGHVAALLALVHGLPSSYHKDLQEAKGPIIALVDDARQCLDVLAGCVATLTANNARLCALAGDEQLYATDIADALTSKDIPFRKAHAAVGALVRASLDAGKPLSALTTAQRLAASPLLGDPVVTLIDPVASRARREVEGGAGPAAVAAAIALARERVDRPWPFGGSGTVPPALSVGRRATGTVVRR